jgi:hypothetical protein
MAAEWRATRALAAMGLLKGLESLYGRQHDVGQWPVLNLPSPQVTDDPLRCAAADHRSACGRRV